MYEESRGGVVLCKKDDSLMCLMLQTKDGEWILPRGKTEAKETDSETAIREIQEETGIKEPLKIVKKIGETTFRYKSKFVWKQKHVVYYLIITNYTETLTPEERYKNVKFLDINEAPETAHYLKDRQIIKRAKREFLGMSIKNKS